MGLPTTYNPLKYQSPTRYAGQPAASIGDDFENFRQSYKPSSSAYAERYAAALRADPYKGRDWQAAFGETPEQYRQRKWEEVYNEEQTALLTSRQHSMNRLNAMLGQPIGKTGNKEVDDNNPALKDLNYQKLLRDYYIYGKDSSRGAVLERAIGNSGGLDPRYLTSFGYTLYAANGTKDKVDKMQYGEVVHAISKVLDPSNESRYKRYKEKLELDAGFKLTDDDEISRGYSSVILEKGVGADLEEFEKVELDAVARHALSTEEYSKYIKLDSVKDRAYFLAEIYNSKKLQLALADENSKERALQSRNTAVAAIDKFFDLYVKKEYASHLHEPLGYAGRALEADANLVAFMYNGTVGAVNQIADLATRSAMWVGQEMPLFLDEEYEEARSIRDDGDKMLSKFAKEGAETRALKFRGMLDPQEGDTDADISRKLKYKNQGIALIESALEQYSPAYNKFKDDKDVMQAIDKYLLFLLFASDSELVGPEIASLNLLNTVLDAIVIRSRALGKDDKWYEVTANLFETFGLSMVLGCANFVAEGLNIVGDSLNGDPLSSIANDEGLINQKYINGMMESGYIDPTKVAEWQAKKEKGEAALGLNEMLLTTAEQESFFKDGNIGAFFSDIMGQYGFTAASSLIAILGPKAFKFGKKPFKWAGNKLSSAMATTESIAMDRALNSAMLEEAEAAAIRTASKGGRTLPLAQTWYTQAAENVAAATESLTQGAKQVYNAVRHPMQTARNLKNGSVFREGFAEEVAALDPKKRAQVEKAVADKAILAASTPSKVGAWAMAGILGSGEGMMEARSTYEEMLGNATETVTRAYQSAHLDQIRLLASSLYTLSNYGDSETPNQAQAEARRILQEEIEAHPEKYAMISLEKEKLRLQFSSEMALARLQGVRIDEAAAAKALQLQLKAIDDLIFQLAALNVAMANLAKQMELDPLYLELIRAAERMSLTAATTNFWLNSGINGFLNGTLKSSNLGKEAREALQTNRRGIKRFISIVDDPSSKLGKKVVVENPGFKGWAKTVKEETWDAFKNASGEGIEEWQQNLSNTASQAMEMPHFINYLVDSYDPLVRDAVIEGIGLLAVQQASTIHGFWDTVDAGTNAALNAAFSQEALTEGFYGAMSTIVGGPSLHRNFSGFKKPTLSWNNEKGFISNLWTNIDKIQEGVLPIQWRNSFLDAVRNYLDYRELARIVSESINGILAGEEGAAFWDHINASAAIDRAYKLALEGGDELEARNYKLLALVLNALLIDSDYLRDTDAAAGWRDNAQKMADLNLDDFTFQQGKLIRSLEVEPLNPEGQEFASEAEALAKMEEYKERKAVYDREEQLKTALDIYGEEDGISSTLTDEEKAKRIVENALKLLDFFNKVRLLSRSYDARYNGKLTELTKAALITTDLLFENQIERLQSLEDTRKGLLASLGSNQSNLSDASPEVLEAIARLGNTPTKTIPALKKNILDNIELLKTLIEALKLSKSDKSREQIEAAQAQIAEFKNALAEVERREEILDNYYSSLEGPIEEGKEEEVKAARKDLVLSAQDILNLPVEQILLMMHAKEGTYSAEQQKILDDLKQKGLDYYNNQLSASLHSLDVFTTALLDEFRLGRSIEALRGERVLMQKNAEKINELGQYLRAMESNREMKKSLDSLIDINNYKNYLEWINAIRAKREELLSKRANNESDVLSEAMLNYITRVLNSKLEYKDYLKKTKIWSDAFFNVSKEDLPEALQEDVNNQARLDAIVKTLISEKKYGQYGLEILSRLDSREDLTPQQREIIKGIIENKEYIPYLLSRLDTYLSAEEKKEDLISQLQSLIELDSLEDNNIGLDLLNFLIESLLDVIIGQSVRENKRELEMKSAPVVLLEPAVIPAVQWQDVPVEPLELAPATTAPAKPNVTIIQLAPVIPNRRRTSLADVQNDRRRLVSLIMPSTVNSDSEDLLKAMEDQYDWSNYLVGFKHLEEGERQKRSLAADSNNPVFTYIKMNVLQGDGQVKTVTVAAVRNMSGDKQGTVAVGSKTYNILGIIDIANEDVNYTKPLLLRNRLGTPYTYSILDFKFDEENPWKVRSTTDSLNIPKIDVSEPGFTSNPKTTIRQSYKDFLNGLTYDVEKTHGQDLFWRGNLVTYANRSLSEATWFNVETGNAMSALDWLRANYLDPKWTKDGDYSNSEAADYNPALSNIILVLNKDFGAITGAVAQVQNGAEDPKNLIANLFRSTRVNKRTGKPYELFRYDSNFIDVKDAKVEETPYGQLVSFELTYGFPGTEEGRKTILVTMDQDNYKEKMFELLEALSTPLSLDNPLSSMYLLVSPTTLINEVGEYRAAMESPSAKNLPFNNPRDKGNSRYYEGLMGLGIIQVKPKAVAGHTATILDGRDEEDIPVSSTPVGTATSQGVVSPSVIPTEGTPIVTGALLGEVQLGSNLSKARQIVKQLQEDDSVGLNPDGEEQYINSETKEEYERTTSILTGLLNYLGEPYDSSNAYHELAIGLGNTMDGLTRAFFESIFELDQYKKSGKYELGIPPTIQLNEEGNPSDDLLDDILRRYRPKNGNPLMDESGWIKKDEYGERIIPNMSELAYIELIRNLINFQNALANKGWFVVPGALNGKEITTYGRLKTSSGATVNVAGTLDLLVYDREGKFRIIDIKTMHYKPGDRLAHTSTTINKLKGHQDRWSALVSIYKELLNQRGLGIVWADDPLYILPVGVRYNPKESTQKIVTDDATLQITIEHYNGLTSNPNSEKIREQLLSTAAGLVVSAKDSYMYPVPERATLLDEAKVDLGLLNMTPDPGIPAVGRRTAEQDDLDLQREEDLRRAYNSLTELQQLDPNVIAAYHSGDKQAMYEAAAAIVQNTGIVKEDEPVGTTASPAEDLTDTSSPITIDDDEYEEDDDLELSEEEKGIEGFIGGLGRVLRYRLTGGSRRGKRGKSITRVESIKRSINKIFNNAFGLSHTSDLFKELDLDYNALIDNPEGLLDAVEPRLQQYYALGLRDYAHHQARLDFQTNLNKVLYNYFTNNLEGNLEDALEALLTDPSKIAVLELYRAALTDELRKQIADEFIAEVGDLEQILSNYKILSEILDSQRKDCQTKLDFINSGYAPSVLRDFLANTTQQVLDAHDALGLTEFSEDISITESVIRSKSTPITEALMPIGVDIEQALNASTLLLNMATATTNELEQTLLRQLSLLLNDSSLLVTFENNPNTLRMGRTEIIENEDNSKGTRIVLNLSNIGDVKDFNRALMHESVHALTHFLLENDEELSLNVQSLLDYSKNYLTQVEGVDPLKLNIYGLTKTSEFVSEFFSNPLFRSALLNIPIIEEDSNKVISVIKQMGRFLMKKLFNKESLQTVYDKAEKELYNLLSIGSSLKNNGTTMTSKEELVKDSNYIKEKIAYFEGGFDRLSDSILENLTKMGYTREVYNELPSVLKEAALDCCS